MVESLLIYISGQFLGWFFLIQIFECLHCLPITLTAWYLWIKWKRLYPYLAAWCFSNHHQLDNGSMYFTSKYKDRRVYWWHTLWFGFVNLMGFHSILTHLMTRVILHHSPGFLTSCLMIMLRFDWTRKWFV